MDNISLKTKICKCCGIEKEINDFYFSKKYYDGKCKICRNNLNGIRRALNKEEINRRVANHRNTPEGKLHRKSQILRYKYNLTIEEYRVMFDNQKGLCNICKKPQKLSQIKYFAVDHDHKTNKVRGLLCSGYNAKLAWLESYKENIDKHLDNPPR